MKQSKSQNRVAILSGKDTKTAESFKYNPPSTISRTSFSREKAVTIKTRSSLKSLNGTNSNSIVTSSQ